MHRRTFLGVSAVASLTCITEVPGDAEAAPAPIVHSNLADAKSLGKAQSLLRGAGVPARRIDVFSQHVEQIRTTFPAKALVAGFEDFASRKPRYESYELQEIWQAKHPHFLGYNCRITAFGLWSQQMRLGKLNRIDDSRLFIDLESLRADPSAMMDRHQLYRFRTLYGRVRTVASTDPKRHLVELQKAWRSRGITMRPNPRLKLVSMVQHDNFDGDELFIGHTGLLLPAKDGLWFLEKLALQEPYQLIRFATRTQLNAYLMGKYDTDTTGTSSAPLIMEDAQLMKGYRRVR